jgi:uncharacterized protein Yka (UPF0111/DUF47 family)
MKSGIVEHLGEAALLQPELVNEALAANDRLKYRFTLLQAARAHAEDPGQPYSDLHREREAAGITDLDLDGVVAASHRDDGAYLIPGAERLHADNDTDLHTMLTALLGGGDGDARSLGARLERLAGMERPSGDRVPPDYVGKVTRGQREHGDSLHLLVMDMHKALNALQASLACESVNGAQAYGLEEADRELLHAFMDGLNATAPLKFDHPGLGTTATHSGDALVIQNDIGTTDAHVLVVRVSGLACTLTYTDIHVRRAAFFKSLFEGAGVDWADDRTRRAQGLEESDSYYLCTGYFRARDHDALKRHLRLLGSRIVFLIDWNKARKRLRQFMRMSDVIALLKWAADHDHGHRGFLELGGERLVYDALESVGSVPLRYGERLDRILGRERVIEHMKFVLRTASQGLLEGRSTRLIRDELKADLMERLHTAEQTFFALLGDHAGLTVDLAGLVRDQLAAAWAGSPRHELELAAQRAKLWETRADQLVIQIREGMVHATERALFSDLAHETDDIADHLEEAACLVPLLPTVAAPAALYPPVMQLADQVLDCAHSLVSCLESARHVQRGGAREDLRDFLEAVDRLVTLEQATDAGARDVTLTLIDEDADHRQLHLLALVAKRMEKAADAGARSGLMLRDHVMSQVMSG